MPFWLTQQRPWLAMLFVFGLSWTTTPSTACDSPTCCCRQPDAVTCVCREAWHVADSPNFQVCSLQGDAEARRVALHCECLRNALTRSWNSDADTWRPRCQVVLHAHVAGYVRAVGGGGEATVGSSLVTPVRGPIGTRRIDLRTDVDDVLVAALPHELCHVVLADRFRSSPAPLWLDEGVALQYDPPAKRQLHERDFRLGLRQGEAFSLAELLEESSYPPRNRWAVFYGQSGSLVRWLLTRESPEKLLQFVDRSRELGASRALTVTYGVAELDDLYRQWRNDAIALDAPLPKHLMLPPSTPFRLVSQ
jgi:hypothetical protein